jgi:hypothetical protein
VNIVLADLEAVTDFKLLLELSYGGSYTRDDEGDLLDRKWRLRLAFMANAFEFSDCINQCLESLVEGL